MRKKTLLENFISIRKKIKVIKWQGIFNDDEINAIETVFAELKGVNNLTTAKNIEALNDIFETVMGGIVPKDADKPRLKTVKEFQASFNILKRLGVEPSTITQSELDEAWNVFVAGQKELRFRGVIS